MVMADDAINNFEAYTLITVYSEFIRILQNMPIFSNIQELER
jgi:hypothetical protein